MAAKKAPRKKKAAAKSAKKVAKTASKAKAAVKKRVKAGAKARQKARVKVKEGVDKSTEKFGEVLDESEATLKQIWLAGLGAYASSLDNIQEKAGKLRKERQEKFEQLVERGQQMQEETNLALSQKVEEVEGRIEKIKQQLADSYSSTLIAQSIEQMGAKLDKLQEKKKR